MYLLSSLMHDSHLVTDPHFPLSPDDFPERFHRIIYGAIDHLVRHGTTQIDAPVIDQYLKHFSAQYAVFEQNSGYDYVCNIYDSFYLPGNFEANYNTVRKCSLLNYLASEGYPITQYYNPTEVDPNEITATQERFTKATTDEILGEIDGRLSSIRNAFANTTVHKSIQAGHGLERLKESYKEQPEMGIPLNSPKLTTITRGRRLTKFYLRIIPSGGGKTRLSCADAALVSIPEYWDTNQNAWVKTGLSQPTVFISTEMEEAEIQTLLVSYVAAIPEERILDGKYLDAAEEDRADHAIELIKQAPLYIDYVPDFNIGDIETIIKEHKARHHVGYVFFDYLQTSMKLLTEIATKANGMKLREDNVLTLFSSRLKLLAQTLNLHIDTSVQANGDWKSVKDPDQNITRGAKAISDKVDVGYCGLPPTEKDIEAFRRICADTRTPFLKEPNLIVHVYKVRRGKWNHVKLFQHFDFGTLRTTDLFATDKDYKVLDINGTNIELILDQTAISEPVSMAGTEPQTEPIINSSEVITEDAEKTVEDIPFII